MGAVYKQVSITERSKTERWRPVNVFTPLSLTNQSDQLSLSWGTILKLLCKSAGPQLRGTSSQWSTVFTQIFLVLRRSFPQVYSSFDHEPIKLMLQGVGRKVRHRVDKTLSFEIQRSVTQHSVSR